MLRNSASTKCNFHVFEDADESRLSKSDFSVQTESYPTCDQCECTEISLSCEVNSNVTDKSADFWRRVAEQKEAELIKLKEENSKLEDMIFDSDYRKSELVNKYNELMQSVENAVNTSESDVSDLSSLT